MLDRGFGMRAAASTNPSTFDVTIQKLGPAVAPTLFLSRCPAFGSCDD